MLATTVLLGGLVAVAQAALDCGAYGTGPSDGTRYTAPDGKQWDIRCHSTYDSASYRWGGDNYPNQEACIAACSAQGASQCNYAAYAKIWNSCLFALTTPAERAAPMTVNNAYSGALLVQPLNCNDGSSNGTVFTAPGSIQKYQVLCNYQYGGNTLGASKRADTLEQCVGFCDAATGCVDAIWSDAKYCWLKSSKTNGYKSGGWHSIVKVPAGFVQPAPAGASAPPPPNSIRCDDNSADGTVFRAPSGAQYDIKCNFQYAGQTLGSSKYTETFEVCADLCDSTAGCVEGIWSNAKYCWLKSSITGNGYKSGGWYSAVKKQNVMITH
ncbi:uncharacterized protein B0I36DRAFT_357223 [Microdochium trichocladiopsis]|uniref:Apple domain-containing protein n=1 Tax=Microdochium trichocladiopsis TaxID=1682393 RepID=A0A9P9BVK4_9PEZI|nr:uncharacterized protein B0I36DRAFT_357223 [Microdochium trichocladiopsis]KAH7039837.1 hypothetical protein B0I36DRAFT_357223 [Microdochium trichocladiopsis]